MGRYRLTHGGLTTQPVYGVGEETMFPVYGFGVRDPPVGDDYRHCTGGGSSILLFFV